MSAKNRLAAGSKKTNRSSPSVENRRRRAEPLSRSTIQRTALTIVDELGLTGLTVRNLAQALGVTPMAVYRHFENKAAIENTLVDLVVGDYQVTNHTEADLHHWLGRTFGAMHQALCEHPGIIPLLAGATYSGSNAVLVLEQVLQRLREAGIGSADATRLFYGLMAYTLGSVMLMDSVVLGQYRESKAVLAELRRQRRHGFASLPQSTYPYVVEAAPHLATHFGGEGFAQGLLSIIDGILGKAAAPQ
ncbi:TetR/AcrR family transcriptional regulator [Denitratisoma oestradiolicum]|uniref:Uncharacterized protein n=1 Tax=Denitratisoma oestradiolicum TaxID=311182 RepID=A0A6S6XWD5_9PROT|nr:TetR/AcrR family transcriptional regulator [Denitratisoma oestradiolicum]TWO82290.1 hypothetical protein CBW56_02280 [Denitratisoma oestradiolicum]CAB1369244.1 conserved protein of unknown function [Denitratisoma oestradiolicum]